MAESFGLICIAIALYCGMEKIAEAICERHKRITVTLPPIIIRYADGSEAKGLGDEDKNSPAAPYKPPTGWIGE